MFSSNLTQCINAFNQAKTRTLEKIGLYVEGEAVVRCPVDTGNLRSSISHDTDDSSVIIGTNVDYTIYVEKGTSKQSAQPYLIPAVEQNIENIKRIVKEEMDIN